ncbi:MAG: hypothetical protein WDO68_19860 [Gammaproteobacteria bacterium]
MPQHGDELFAQFGGFAGIEQRLAALVERVLRVEVKRNELGEKFERSFDRFGL